jgi:hypothetical protein
LQKLTCATATTTAGTSEKGKKRRKKGRRSWTHGTRRKACKVAPRTYTFLILHEQRQTVAGAYEYLVCWDVGTVSWQPAANIDAVEQLWEERYNIDHIDECLNVRRVPTQGPDGQIVLLQVQDGKNKWHNIHKPEEEGLHNGALMWAIRELEKEPLKIVRVPSIDRVRIRTVDGKQVTECQFDTDNTRAYREFAAPTEGPVWDALVKCVPDGDSVEIDGGCWSDHVTALPDASPHGGPDGRPVTSSLQQTPSIPTPFQFDKDNCVKGSVLNAELLTEPERAIVGTHMPSRFNMKDIPDFFMKHCPNLRLHKPKTWYPGYMTDQQLHKLLDYLLSPESSGHIIVNVMQHYMLFDCDRRLVFDSDKRFGGHALPLTQATMELMGVTATGVMCIRKANKLARPNRAC